MSANDKQVGGSHYRTKNGLKHLHHIVPRHAGGSNDPDNLVLLSVEDHAEAHRLLYLEHGRWQDLIAWRGLSGAMGKEELISKIISLTHSGKAKTQEHKFKIAQRLTGVEKSREHRAKLSALKKGIVPWSATEAAAKANTGVKRPEHSKAMSGSNNPNYGSGVCTIPLEARARGAANVSFEKRSARASGKVWWTNGEIDVRNAEQPAGFTRGRSSYSRKVV